MITQFIAAFDDIVIGRFNKHREEKDKIEVRYVYAPKQRVLYDIINENKTLTLPVVSVNIGSISRDETRVFNKIDGFFYQGQIGGQTVSRHVKAPIPVNLNLEVSILSRYQTDIDQIISNFVPFCNPYVIISWKVPDKFNLSKDQEIRSEVLWNGDINLDYPTELNSNQKARIVGSTSFTIKGWLFKDTTDDVGNIYFVDSNFHNVNEVTSLGNGFYYDNYDSLSSNDTFTHPTSSGLINEVETISVSGSPTVTDIFYDNIRLFDNLTLTSGTTGNVIINGYGFNNLQNIYLSSNKFEKLSSDGTNINDHLVEFKGFTNNQSFTGFQLSSYNVFGENVVSFNLPSLSATNISNSLDLSANNNFNVTFVLYNTAGYDLTTQTLESNSLSSNNTLLSFTVN